MKKKNENFFVSGYTISSFTKVLWISKVMRIIRIMYKCRFEYFLALFAFAFLFYFKKDFMLEWDAYDYVQQIYHHYIPNLFLGRLGFMAFFVGIWEILNRFFSYDILQFHHVVRLCNMFFATASIVCLYLLMKELLHSKRIAFGSAMFFLFSRDFLLFSSEPVTEIMMLCVLLGGVLCYVKSFNGRKSYFYLSAVLFGYTLTIREQAIVTIFFILIASLFDKRKRIFDCKTWAGFLFLLMFVAIVPPLVGFIRFNKPNPEGLAFYFSQNKIEIFPIAENIKKTVVILKTGFGNLLLPMAGVGVLLKRKRYQELAILSAFFISVFFLMFYKQTVPRHFLVIYPALAGWASVFLYYSSDYLRRKLKFCCSAKSIFMIFLSSMLLFDFMGFYEDLISEKEKAKHVEQYGLTLLKCFPDNTIFLVGKHSSLMYYYISLTHSKKGVLWSGWLAPSSAEEWACVMRQYLRQGKKLVVDLKQYMDEDYDNERNGLMCALKGFEEKKYIGDFIIIEN